MPDDTIDLEEVRPPRIEIGEVVDIVAAEMNFRYNRLEVRHITTDHNWITIRNGEQTIFVCVMEVPRG